MLQINKTIKDNNTVIIELDGRFDGIGANLLDEEISKLTNFRFIIFEFSNVNYLSSAGIRILLKTEKQLRAAKGKMILVNISQSISQILRITGLLDKLSICNNQNDAIELINSIYNNELNNCEQRIQDREYFVKTISGNSSFKVWRNNSLDKPNTAHVNMILSNLEELKLAYGTGSPGINRKEAFEYSGKFFTTKNFLGVTRGNNVIETDYVFSVKPDETFIYLNNALSIDGAPSFLFEVKSDNYFSINTLINDVISIVSGMNESGTPLLGFAVIAGLESETTKKETEGSVNKGFFAIGTALDKLESQKLKANEHIDLVKSMFNQNNNDILVNFDGVVLNNLNILSESDEIDEAVHSVLNENNLCEESEITNNIRITHAKIWIYIPSEVTLAETSRLQIEVENDFEMSDEFELITRKIYSECSRIILKQLHGGFSAKTFQVSGYDKNGIRILPTVLKLGSRSCMKREAEHYNEFVNKYILNNSTSIMGSYFYNNSGGVRYNFVGINGPDTKLRWLTHHYREKSTEELLPLFDRIFTYIFKPWYGQPKLEIIYPYKEHNPVHTFFPEIFDDCQKELGINADEETIYFEELGREIVNPYWFLKYEFKKREGYSKLWYKCISHGDLNMQNILLDETNNIYMIDFSETQLRNAVSDFARLEPIVKFEIPELDNNDELKYMAEYEQGLLKVNKLNEKPEFIYRGNDPSVEKSYHIICRLREYADTVTLFETDLIPYLLAILEWTYPVVSYYSVDIRRKKLSAISAALICEKIIELEKS